MIFKHPIYLLIPVLLLACVKELPVDLPAEGEVTATVPYSVVVYSSESTRVSINDDSFATGRYIFQSGDRLYVEYKDGGTLKLYGMLSLSDGQGTGTGTFGGSLNSLGGYLPQASTQLTATLVGAGQEESGFYTISSDQITAGPTYPATIPYIEKANDSYSPDLQEYVKKYSHFTATARYDAKSFTLQQQTVFLNGHIDQISKSLLLDPYSTSVSVSIKKGGSAVRTFSGINMKGGSYSAQISFIGVLSLNDDISSGEIWIDNNRVKCGDDISSTFTLEANHYYNLSRSLAQSWDGFKITATTSDTRITFNYASSSSDGIQYSLDFGRNWVDYVTSDGTIPGSSMPALCEGEEIWMRGKRNKYQNTLNGNNSTPLFSSVGNRLCYISGNMMSLLCNQSYVFGTTLPTNAFTAIFRNTSWIDIQSGDEGTLLPVTTLSNSCYREMFRGCTSLTNSPSLPATTSAESCYQSMFNGCTELTTPPSSLPVTTVEKNAFNQMFYGCIKLTSAPEFSFTTVKDYGCKEMFKGCLAMTTPPSSLPATTLNKQAYYHMFYQCKALTSVPDFPHDPNGTYELYSGTADKDGVCYQMFFECKALTTLAGKKLFNSDTQLGAYCFQDMFSTCSNLVTVPSDFLPATSLAESCYRGMFQQTAITNAPDLLAETLVSNCYRWMFNQCKSIVYIKCYSTSSGSNTYTQKWLENAKNTEDCKFHYRSGVNWARENTYGIPTNWEAIADTVQ